MNCMWAPVHLRGLLCTSVRHLQNKISSWRTGNGKHIKTTKRFIQQFCRQQRKWETSFHSDVNGSSGESVCRSLLPLDVTSVTEWGAALWRVNCKCVYQSVSANTHLYLISLFLQWRVHLFSLRCVWEAMWRINWRSVGIWYLRIFHLRALQMTWMTESQRWFRNTYLIVRNKIRTSQSPWEAERWMYIHTVLYTAVCNVARWDLRGHQMILTSCRWKVNNDPEDTCQRWRQERTRTGTRM